MATPRAPVTAICTCGEKVKGKRVKLAGGESEEVKFDCPKCHNIWFE